VERHISSSDEKIARRLKWLALSWLVFGVLEAGRTVALIILAPQINWNWLQTSTAVTRWTDFVMAISILKGRSYGNAPKLGPGFTEWLQTWSAAMVVLSVVAAFALYSRKRWGRTSALIAAFFGLIHPVVGTVLAVYTLIVLLPASAAAEYRQIACNPETVSPR
jgi:hypothetical protein